MAHDLFFKNSKRNWARSSATTSLGDDARPATTKTGKVMLGGMAVATAIGLAFITSPWWLPINPPVATARPTLPGIGSRTPARNYRMQKIPWRPNHRHTPLISGDTMPTEHTILAYQLNELAPAAKNRAIAKIQEQLSEDFDADYLSDLFKEQLEEQALPIKDIRWRLSNSQGDGVAFYGPFDLVTYLKRQGLFSKYRSLSKFYDDVQASLNKRGAFHMYDHWNTMVVELDTSRCHLTKKQEELFDEMSKEITSHIQDVSRKLEKLGYEAYEGSTSEEAAIEHAEANNYQFDENGRII